jgi:hypothetical protein
MLAHHRGGKISFSLQIQISGNRVSASIVPLKLLLNYNLVLFLDYRADIRRRQHKKGVKN